jgi:hypothetical protein
MRATACSRLLPHLGRNPPFVRAQMTTSRDSGPGPLAADLTNNAPIAHAVPLEHASLTELEIGHCQEYSGTSVAQRYRGPSWLVDATTACVVLVAHDAEVPKRLRAEKSCAFIAWRWNDTPSAYFSLTLLLRSGTRRPHVRWFRPSSDSVVQAIRASGKFFAIVASPDGQSSGWFVAEFGSGFVATAASSRDALERLWEFPVAGLPFSNTRARFDPARREAYEPNRKDEIPLWVEEASDFWRTLKFDGPWAEDLEGRDRAAIAWATQAVRHRQLAAGFIQVLIERQRYDNEAAYFSAEGRILRPDSVQEKLNELVSRFPLIGYWLAALAGPDPSAKLAHKRACDLLRDPPSLFVAVGDLLGLLNDLGDEDLGMASKCSFEAALLDSQFTREGTQRPWLANSPLGLEIRGLPVRLDAASEDINSLWANATELVDLLDAGIFKEPGDFPIPYELICEGLETIELEGTVEEAEDRVAALLLEAQQARQWSIPWGARVEIALGPFTALRIFELDGEFVCHFLDSQERYATVAIGLRNLSARIASFRIIKPRNGSDAQWNDAAEATLKLVASAIVRDFLVVEERESLFTCRPYRRRVRGQSIRSVIYLPRVLYSRPHQSRFTPESAPTPRSAHQVASHLRRSAKASAAQRFLAQRYGVSLPIGFTFVRAHQRGKGIGDERIRIYRSRSASRMIFEAVTHAPVGTRPAWFDFEKDCLRLLRTRGFSVVHQAADRSGDGGVDLYAIDRENRSWVVQCKNWSAHRAIGPEVIRELAGAIVLSDKDNASQASGGIVITTSSFTTGAIEAAALLGYELIDGVRFTEMLSKVPPNGSWIER